MPTRVSAPARERDYDYSNIGKVGRRTGVTLAPRPLDEHGLEEITGLFSSPKKPSPASNKRAIIESVESPQGSITPTGSISTQVRTPLTTGSARRSNRVHSHPPPRSASPKKSGITGTARRSGAIDVLANKQLQEELLEDVAEQDDDAQVSAVPRPQTINARAASAGPATIVKRFSPNRTPLRNRVLHQRAAKSAVVARVSDAHSFAQDETFQDDDPEETPSRGQLEPMSSVGITDRDTTEAMHIMADEEEEEEQEASSVAGNIQQHIECGPQLQSEPELADHSVVDNDYSDEDQTFEPPSKQKVTRSVPNKANSRRKRKSDALEDGESITVAISSPTSKRAKERHNEENSSSTREPESKKKSLVQHKTRAKPNATPQAARARKALGKKDTNSKLSSERQRELDDVVEKIRARPIAPRSLYVLRRETPADDTVTHTRSGRISIKPLAYWRNEHCVYSGTPGRWSAGVEDGARFPLNSIKEIVRNDEVASAARTKARKSRKTIGKGKGRRDAKSAEDSDSELDLNADGEIVDPDADDWELNPGTLTATVASWDPEHQTGVPEESFDTEVAYAHAAIQTKDVKGSTFRYAKLLSSRFFGAGVVDLPGGGIKRAKNSKKMHMCFFVVQGRVSVRVGGIGGQAVEDDAWGTRFSIGKGGFWQVPRGNQYSIENEHGKTARIFFSQGCEAAPGELDE